MIFINIQKAFDSVEWHFLGYLEALDFGPDMTIWIRTCTHKAVLKQWHFL